MARARLSIVTTKLLLGTPLGRRRQGSDTDRTFPDSRSRRSQRRRPHPCPCQRFEPTCAPHLAQAPEGFEIYSNVRSGTLDPFDPARSCRCPLESRAIERLSYRNSNFPTGAARWMGGGDRWNSGACVAGCLIVRFSSQGMGASRCAGTAGKHSRGNHAGSWTDSSVAPATVFARL